MRITLFIGTLGAGGAERALVVLSEGLQEKGHDVTILTWINQEEDFYRIPKNVVHVKADIPKSVVSTRWYNLVGGLRRLRAIRKAIAKTNPDLVISFLDGNNELFLLSSVGEQYIKIISCQNDMSVHPHFNQRWEKLREIIYIWADKIVFLDGDQAKDAVLHNHKWSCLGIPNPVVDIDLKPDEQAQDIITEVMGFPIRLIAMGRLDHQKGFDLLLTAFKKINEKYPDALLIILGEGPLREELQRQVQDLDLNKNVIMPGRLSNPHSVISRCHVFIFSSRYEGQGLALVEAMACGIAAVSFNCPSGPSYIIQDQVNGILVPPEDTQALADSVIKLLDNDEKRFAIAKEAIHVSEKYSVENITEEWEKLYQNIKK